MLSYVSTLQRHEVKYERVLVLPMNPKMAYMLCFYRKLIAFRVEVAKSSEHQQSGVIPSE